MPTAGLLQYQLKGDAAFLFLLRWKQQKLPGLDNIHRNTAQRLTIKAMQNLDDTRLRPKESGSRPNSRLTGTLQGKHGHSRAIRGTVLSPGSTASGKRQAKGVGWPQKDLLDRRARHWRALEFGTPYTIIPRGVFVSDSGSFQGLDASRAGQDRFMTYKEALAGRGLSTKPLRSIRAGGARTNARNARPNVVLQAQRGKGIKAKHFLEDAWNEVVGTDARYIEKQYVDLIDSTFSQFKGRRG